VAVGYSEPERSELERRFEALFSQVFRCSWQDYLTAQYPIQGADGKSYYIDYVYEGNGERIGIELDGRGKFYQYKHVFNNFFKRQNAIQLAGITVYRFTWTDVVEDGSWRARKQLTQIFKGKLTKPANALVPSPIKPPVAQVIEVPSWPSSQESEAAPPFKKMALGIVAVGVIAILLNFIRLPVSQESSQAPSSISEVKPTQETRIQTSQMPVEGKSQAQVKADTALQPASQPITRTVYVPVIPNHKPSVKPATPGKPTQSESDIPREAILPPAIQPQVVSPQAETPALAEHVTQKPAIEPDEIVAFNQESGIFHKPNSYWGRKCTRNCIYIPKSQAIQMGGRPSRANR
jgi:hypothetical protein